MKIGIKQKLFLAILAASLLSVISMFTVLRLSLDRGLLRYANSLEQSRLSRLATTLEERYAREGNWNSLALEPGGWLQLVADSMPDREPGFPDHPPPPSAGPHPGRENGNRPPSQPHPGRGFANRLFLLDAARKPLLAVTKIPVNTESRALKQGDNVIGYLGILPHKHLSDERQLRFLKEQQTAFAIVAVIIVLLAAGLSLPLSIRLTRPLRALAMANDRLATGHFDTRLPVTSSDELGQLARDFNALALTLEKNELARRQWVADISHEIRTPLAILRGEIEALQDGIRQLNPEAINSLHLEVMRLNHLVNDLYQLSLSDLGALTYRKEEVDLADLFMAVLLPYRQEFTNRSIDFEASIPAGGKTVVYADVARLQQLFSNLLDNSLKYTDPGGRAVLRLSSGENTVEIIMEDSPPGVSYIDLGKLFDRLYRVETSRCRNTGGAGLGLAICRNIVEAHAGKISAEQSVLGGVRIKVVLPLLKGVV